MKFKHAGDEVVACDIAREDAWLLHITTRGYGKRTPVDDFPRKGRGGMGVVGIKLTADKGEVVGTLMVDADDDILAMTKNGVLIRTGVADISTQGRSASGVRVMNPDDEDAVASVALVTLDADEEPHDEPHDELGDESADGGDPAPGDSAPGGADPGEETD